MHPQNTGDLSTLYLIKVAWALKFMEKTIIYVTIFKGEEMQYSFSSP